MKDQNELHETHMHIETKKILRIRKGEYLQAMYPNGVKTTKDKEKAMDITNWTLEQLGYVAQSLKRAGYTKPTVETINLLQKEDLLSKGERMIRTLMENNIFEPEDYDPDKEIMKKLLEKKLDNDEVSDQ